MSLRRQFRAYVDHHAGRGDLVAQPAKNGKRLLEKVRGGGMVSLVRVLNRNLVQNNRLARQMSYFTLDGQCLPVRTHCACNIGIRYHVANEPERVSLSPAIAGCRVYLLCFLTRVDCLLLLSKKVPRMTLLIAGTRQQESRSLGLRILNCGLQNPFNSFEIPERVPRSRSLYVNARILTGGRGK